MVDQPLSDTTAGHQYGGLNGKLAPASVFDPLRPAGRMTAPVAAKVPVSCGGRRRSVFWVGGGTYAWLRVPMSVPGWTTTHPAHFHEAFDAWIRETANLISSFHGILLWLGGADEAERQSAGRPEQR